MYLLLILAWSHMTTYLSCVIFEKGFPCIRRAHNQFVCDGSPQNGFKPMNVGHGFQGLTLGPLYRKRTKIKTQESPECTFPLPRFTVPISPPKPARLAFNAPMSSVCILKPAPLVTDQKTGKRNRASQRKPSPILSVRSEPTTSYIKC